MVDYYITDDAAEDIEKHWNAYSDRGGSETNADLFMMSTNGNGEEEKRVKTFLYTI